MVPSTPTLTSIELEPVYPPKPPLLTVDPAALPPLCDAYTNDSVYLWHKLVFHGYDLIPEPCGEDEQGHAPFWWEAEDDKSLDNLLSPEWTHTNYEGHRFSDRWLRWGLENGLAPGQPFLVRVDEPRHYRCSYEYDEWDIEWTVDVVRVMPRTPAQALRAWGQTLDRVRRYYDIYLKKWDRLQLLQDTDASAYSMSKERYTTCVREGSPQVGIRLYLRSAHNSMWGNSKQGACDALIALGDDPNNYFKQAFRNLLENIRKNRPRVDISTVIRLSSALGSLGITRWDMLRDENFELYLGV